jgi:hypothetical protein
MIKTLEELKAMREMIVEVLNDDIIQSIESMGLVIYDKSKYRTWAYGELTHDFVDGNLNEEPSLIGPVKISGLNGYINIDNRGDMGLNSINRSILMNIINYYDELDKYYNTVYDKYSKLLEYKFGDRKASDAILACITHYMGASLQDIISLPKMIDLPSIGINDSEYTPDYTDKFAEDVVVFLLDNGYLINDVSEFIKNKSIYGSSEEYEGYIYLNPLRE